jgi:CRISPR-associated protein Csd2
MKSRRFEDKQLDHRFELVWLFDVQNGNPNGDPDADNQPRVDPETGHGLVTDVAAKRKVRNFVTLTKSGQTGYEIYVKERGILANEQKRAYTGLNIEPDGKNIEKARAWMCKNFYDVRTFGAVMTTGKAAAEEEEQEGKKEKQRGGKKKMPLWNCGQVRGPVQFAFARSIDPIVSIGHTITRVALTNAGDTRKEAEVTEEGEERAASGQFGRKHAVLYGLYEMHGFISPFFAKDTVFTEKDLEVLIEAISNAFEIERTASKGEMSTRRLYLFEHSSDLGNAPAHKVFESVTVPSVDRARSFSQYEAVIKEPKDGAEVSPGVRAWRFV